MTNLIRDKCVFHVGVIVAPAPYLSLAQGASRYDVRLGWGEGGHGKADVVREVA